jgi:hypothetical protein
LRSSAVLRREGSEGATRRFRHSSRAFFIVRCSARRPIDLLREKAGGTGRVFIDTRGLREICPFGCTAFQCELALQRLPAEPIVFQGENGLQTAPDGIQAAADSGKPACGCRGNFAGCGCAVKTRCKFNIEAQTSFCLFDEKPSRPPGGRKSKLPVAENSRRFAGGC